MENRPGVNQNADNEDPGPLGPVGHVSEVNGRDAAEVVTLVPRRHARDRIVARVGVADFRRTVDCYKGPPKSGAFGIRQHVDRGNTLHSCAICGDLTFDYEWDLQLFMLETDALVCIECGDTCAPDLARALRAARQPYSYRLGGKDEHPGLPWETRPTAKDTAETSADMITDVDNVGGGGHESAGEPDTP